MDLSWETFETVDMRIGRIIRVEPNEKARKPAYKLWVDLGEELGVRQSSAQITDLYEADTLPGRLVVCVINFPPKRIAGFKSELLVMGVPDEKGNVILLRPERDAPLGSRVF